MKESTYQKYKMKGMSSLDIAIKNLILGGFLIGVNVR